MGADLIVFSSGVDDLDRLRHRTCQFAHNDDRT